MFFACLQGRSEVVKFLIEKGLLKKTTNCINSNGDSVLAFAANADHSIDSIKKDIVDYVDPPDFDRVIELLCEASVDVSLKNKGNINAFHCAARNGYLSILKILISKGKFIKQSLNLAINTQSKNGMTPLDMAALGGHKDCVKFLLENGSIPSQSNKWKHCENQSINKLIVDYLKFLEEKLKVAQEIFLDEKVEKTEIIVKNDSNDPKLFSIINNHNQNQNKSNQPSFLKKTYSSNLDSNNNEKNSNILDDDESKFQASSNKTDFSIELFEDQLKNIYPLSTELDIHPHHLFGFGLNNLSMQQLDALEEIHEKSRKELNKWKIKLIENQQRYWYEEELLRQREMNQKN